MKIVKTLKLEEISKMLQGMGLDLENLLQDLEKFDGTQKNLEKEVEAFLSKFRGRQLFSCEQKVADANEAINKLIRKLQVVGAEVDTFKTDLAQA